MILSQLISACQKEDPKAQKELYERYSSRFFGVCKRYIKQEDLAEDVLIKGFMKIFTNVKDFNGTGNFEGWMNKIFINECLMELRKNQQINYNIDDFNLNFATPTGVLETLYEKDILGLLNYLPEGCRTVFNLYVIEGYKHQEISELLNISEGTSKSQLNLAKTKLKVLLEKHGIQKTN